MSTRCVVCFNDGADDEPQAIIYRHSDGYPSGVGQDVLDFLKHVKVNVPDNRFDDASYLAAKFVVWSADKLNYRCEPTQNYAMVKCADKLEFRGVGVNMQVPSDVDFIYVVRCGMLNTSSGTPQVECYRASDGKLGRRVSPPNVDVEQ
jgi:hypothetical protein